NKIDFEIREGSNIDFDPAQGTIARANVICPCCNTGIPARDTRTKFQAGENNQQMIVVIRTHPDRRGKSYRLATNEDITVYNKAEETLKVKRQKLFDEWGMDPVPDEKIQPTPSNTMGGTNRVLNYNLLVWGDLFNSRQKLTIITVINLIKKIQFDKIIANENATKLFLAIAVNRIADKNSNLCRHIAQTQAIGYTWGRHALSMIWDYVEMDIFRNKGGWSKTFDEILINIERCSENIKHYCFVNQSSATSLKHENNSLDAIFTDPPYYDNIPYAYISDFFYVWLKRTIGNLYPDLLSTPLTPKSDEIVAYSNKNDGLQSGEIFFETMMTKAFREFSRILKPNGIAHLVYAHKSTEGWESIMGAILDSGLVLSASWPIHTEMKDRLIANQSAALASSIYMVCRKRNTDATAYYNEIKPSIEKRIHEKLDQFWAEGIGGSDFFISAIGPAVEVFGKYASVEKLSGEKVSVKELLEYVRQTVSEFALSRILKSPQLGGVDQLTRFYLVWRWTFGNNLIPFDDGNKMALSIGVGLDDHWDKGGIIEKTKGKVKVKSHVERRKDRTFESRIKREYPQIDEAGGVPASKQTLTLIDVLQECLILWNRSDRTSIARLLEASGYRKNDLFWQVAQSISDVLPDGDKEKQTIQGFLLGKESYMKGEVPLDTQDSKQETMFGDE
ncbi:MAG: DUF1156 domain-containing protein, partial [Candidatus Marinimicrobia bacterium]|nr:DUF1156 domain-containing protein [Candidatus Neomarinimicrobiota bacterium]